jgi:hypothetical protein
MVAALAATFLTPAAAAAMCGCMMPVDDTGIPETTTLTSDATQVVLMRDGTTTVQTMQNRYEGPLANFALVVPTPEVLTKEQVKTLKPTVFENIDRASAPRLSEYWQHDPCEEVPGFGTTGVDGDTAAANNGTRDDDPAPPSEGGVVVEAEFAVGEYEIQILSAEEGIGLEDWLVDNGYRIPQGASKYLQPYIDAGMYFFVAKVNVDEVNFVDDQAVLSPIRFHYTQEAFTLPTRLGMINSAGRQDLIVYTLGSSRYQAANLPNATIPTNVKVEERVKDKFPTFYDQLLEKTIDANGEAVVTEFASGPWQVPPQDLSSLGADVLAEQNPNFYPQVLTRLHFRYEEDGIGEDVVFEMADPITGGMEQWNERTVDPTLMEQGTNDADWNNFRAHYIITHPWNGPVNCENPVNNRWGGNPDSDNPSQPETVQALSPNSTGDEVFASHKNPPAIEGLVAEDVPEIDLVREQGTKTSPTACSSSPHRHRTLPAALLVIAFGMFGWIRWRRV